MAGAPPSKINDQNSGVDKLPDGWKMYFSEQYSRDYCYNKKLGITSWQFPQSDKAVVIKNSPQSRNRSTSSPKNRYRSASKGKSKLYHVSDGEATRKKSSTDEIRR